MKGLYLLTFFLFTLSSTHSQEITATLSGNTSSQGFSILNAATDTLFRVRGDGAIGIGTNNPIGLFDLNVTTAVDGRPVFIYGENTSSAGAIGGYVEIAGGSNNVSSQKGGQIILDGAPVYDGDGAGVNIKAGAGNVGGNVDIISGSGDNSAGSINISTPFSYEGWDHINISTGGGSNGTGSIALQTGSANGSGAGNVGHINITTGNGINDGTINIQTGDVELGGDINLQAGNITDGGNINLSPSTSGGLVQVNGSGTYSGTWTQTSDGRYKKHVKILEKSLEKLQQIDGVSYEFKKDEFPEKNFPDGKQIGLIAQNVEKVYPELVKTDAEGYKSVAYQNLVAVLIQAVKEQQRSIDELRKEVEQLKSINKAKNVEVSSLGN